MAEILMKSFRHVWIRYFPNMTPIRYLNVLALVAIDVNSY